MKIMHPPVGQGVVTALHDVFAGGYPADKVIQRQLKMHRKWGSSDRRLFAECVYDIVRWWRRILYAAGDVWPSELSNDLVQRAVSVWCEVNQVSTSREASGLKGATVLERWKSSDAPRAVRESVPDWLDSLGASELGADWDRILSILNTVAPVYLRANGLKTTASKLRVRLSSENVESIEAGEDGLVLVKRTNVFLSRAFKDGLFEVQDLNSQKVARALNPKPGERVVDACAGAGGKSLHLAALMGNKGKIIALDVHEKKLEALRERSTRAGATCIETRWIENSKTIKRLHDSADRLLLDVPCSGLGVVRRNPDSK
jgi:16S rRNA (cytosine967-C5)-methyltransferase